jgi:hypothetical protein
MKDAEYLIVVFGLGYSFLFPHMKLKRKPISVIAKSPKEVPAL